MSPRLRAFCASFTLYFDGRFQVGFEEFDEEKLEIIRETIEGSVPSGMLVVFETGPIVLA